MNRKLSGVKVLVLLSLACLAVFGQANQGSITGVIRDQSGAVVPNAPVTLRNTGTGGLYTGGASATGNYVVRVPEGTYELTVAVDGFSTFVQTGIPVVEGQATRRDVTLEVGQISDVVTVTDTAPLLKTEGGDVSYRVESSTANSLPVLQLGGASGLGNIRSPLSMTQLLPGVDFNPSGFDTLVVNGLPANSQTWTIEGQDATPTLWRGVTSDRGQGGVDAIEAMSVQTSNFAAEYGKAGGAAINYTMKSGTNDYHGTAYDYFINEMLHAGTPNTDYAWTGGSRYAYKSGQHIRNKQRRNDYGFTIGGPIYIPGVYDGHDKAFFFFNFEQFRETQNIGTGQATVPTLDYRQGNFAAAGCQDYDSATGTCLQRQQITQNGAPAVDSLGNALINSGVYDPATYQIVGGLPVRTLFPDNQVPLNRFDPVALNIQDMMPLPTNGSLTNNYAIPAYDNARHTTIPSIKLDYNLNQSWRINGYWGQTIFFNPNYNGFSREQFPWTSQQFNNYHNHTVRINLDGTLTPTLLFHVGIGYFHQREPNIAPPFDQSTIGLPAKGQPNAFPAADVFPTIRGLTDGSSGGFSPALGVGFDAVAWEQKPTANINMTWVKGNHTVKYGGDLTLEGYPTHNKWRANGNFSYSAAQTGNPWENGQTLNINNPSGFNYASFMLGYPGNLQLAQQTFTRLGGKAISFFLQDNWKVTPKWTLEYGLRYDYQTYLKEQHGRMAIASFETYNPTVDRLGAIIYENKASCGCNFTSNYGLAFGPRLSSAYQISDKTVFRAGFGINYNVLQTPAGNNFSVGDNYVINAPGYGLTPMPQGMQTGFAFYPGNPYGNTEVKWPVFDPGRLPVRNAGQLPPASNIRLYHPGSRPARITTWSIGLQHEVLRDLVIEANYVGNRGAWFYAPLLDTMSSNTLAGGQLERFGLSSSDPNDLNFLRTQIGTPQAAAAGFGLPYVGFPETETIGQSLRPVPQWNTVLPYLGPNRATTWYDSLQFQATKRYSYGLDLNVNFTWAKGSVIGASSDTDFFLRGRPTVSDPFNRGINKQINQLVAPLKTVISGTYTTPGFAAGSTFGRMASTFLKDWQIGAVLQYQSGQILTTPNSNNQLSNLLQINLPNNGSFGAGVANYNPWNWNGSTQWFNVGDINSTFGAGGYDPRNIPSTGVSDASILNRGIWTDPPQGQWGATSPYLEGFRWRRQPNEAMSIARNFRMGSEGRVVLMIRAEFQNILNRMFYNAPSTTNPNGAIFTTNRGDGVRIPWVGYGIVNTLNGAGSMPRRGTLVARLTF